MVGLSRTCSTTQLIVTNMRCLLHAASAPTAPERSTLPAALFNYHTTPRAPRKQDSAHWSTFSQGTAGKVRGDCRVQPKRHMRKAPLPVPRPPPPTPPCPNPHARPPICSPPPPRPVPCPTSTSHFLNCISSGSDASSRGPAASLPCPSCPSSPSPWRY